MALELGSVWPENCVAWDPYGLGTGYVWPGDGVALELGSVWPENCVAWDPYGLGTVWPWN